MNEKIITELNEIIVTLLEGFNKYGLHSCITCINRIQNIIAFIELKDYEFLSLNEAIACSRAFYI